MLYENYEKKIIRKVKVLKVLYRFRFAILGSLAGILATGCALVGTKGLVRDKEKLNNVYVYGEKLTYTSKSFMSDVSYEFASQDSDNWSSSVPKLVGKYKMRSKGTNSFKKYYYGKEQNFEIIPKVITITPYEDKITYGEVPSIRISDQLCYSDTLTSDYTFTYSDKTKTSWDITPVKESIHIVNGSGGDASSCYKFKVETKKLDILKREIHITTNTSEKTYDSQSFYDKGYELTSGSLVEGDKLSVSYWTKVTNVSSVDNELNFAVYNSNNKDVSKLYNIVVENGTLTINKRAIELTSPDVETTYDGTNYRNYLEDITYESTQLASGENLVLDYESDDKFVKVGEYENAFTAKIVKGDTDVSSNYDITLNFGTTAIAKRDISITTGTYEKTYDATPLEVTNVTIVDGSLADKDTFSSTVVSYTESGVYDNDITAKIIDKDTYEDFSSCYNVTLSGGKIVINPVDLTFTITQKIVTYDGKPHTNEINLTSGSLVAEDYYELTKVLEKTDANTYDNDCTEIDVYKVDGTPNTQNYNINFEGQEDALIINKRPITIKTISKEKVYDGKSIVTTNGSSDQYEITSGSLAENEYLLFDYVNDLTDVGTDQIVCAISILHMKGETIDETVDNVVTSNYEIELDNGDFTITQRGLTIKTLDYEHVYNRDTTLPGLDTILEVTGLAENQQITNFDISCEGINVSGSPYPYIIDENSLVIRDENNNDVTSNYDVIDIINTGKVTITKRPITVTLLGDSAIYDGKNHIFTKHTVTNILEDDYVYFHGLPELKHVWDGPVTNSPSGGITVHLSSGEDITDNYKVSLTSPQPQVRIDPRPITLASQSGVKTFDGKPFEGGAISTISGSLADGDRFEVVSLVSVDQDLVNAGIYENTFEVKFYNSDDEDVTADYDVTYQPGTIEIKPLPLTMAVTEHHFVYNGEAQQYHYDELNVSQTTPDVRLVNCEIPEGFFIDVHLDTQEMLHISDENHIYDEYEVSYDFGTTTSYNSYATDYDITFVENAQFIEPRAITIQTLGGNKIYDGEAFGEGFDESDIVWVSSGSLASGHTLHYDRTPIVDLKEDPTEPYINEIKNIVIRDGDGNDVTENYIISTIFGEVYIYEE